MGSFAFPQNNPTGLTGAGTFNTTSGFNQIPGTGTGGSGNMNFGNTMNPMPQTSTTSGGSGQPMTSTAYTTAAVTPQATSSGSPTNPVLNQNVGGDTILGSNNPYNQTEGQQYWTQDYLEKTFGGGMGSLIYQYLMSNGGYNSGVTQQAVDATTNSMQRQTQLGANNLVSTESAMGVTGGSPGLGDTLATYENQATAQENAITAQDYYQMWNESQQNELNMMQFAATGTAKYLANKPTALDYATTALEVIGAVGSVLI